MKAISVLALVMLCASLPTLTIETLRTKFAWPQEKPNVSADLENMCVNQAQLLKFLSSDTKVIVELGSWLGGSTRFFLDAAPNALVIAVDHWKGGLEHQQFPFWAQKLPTLYETFLVNCWDYQERLIPIRATTLQGLREIYSAGVRPDIIYIDAGHDYASVKEDLEQAYALFPYATIMGDDWSWYMVRLAVIQFCLDHGLAYASDANFWYIYR